MKKLISLFVVLTATFTNAQEQSNWKKSGTVTLLFNQSAFNNEWLGGGVYVGVGWGDLLFDVEWWIGGVLSELFEIGSEMCQVYIQN